MESTVSTKTTHILAFPFPAQGHMIPLLDLTHQIIATSSSSVTVTVLVTPKNLHLLDQLLSVHPDSVQTLVLPFPPHPSLSAGVENAKDLPSGDRALFPTFVAALSGLHAPLSAWLGSHPSPPVAVVSDFFLGWTHRLGIPRVVFSPSGAMALSTVYSLWTRLPTRPSDGVVSFPEIPNCPKYPWREISPLYRSYAEKHPDSELLEDALRGNFASWGVIVNTFSKMERLYLEHLKQSSPRGRVWAVGPVGPTPGSVAARGGPSSVPADRLVQWLDACGDRTVVYACFGSQAALGRDQAEALAMGLEMSGARFVWAVGRDEGFVLAGFEDRTAGRGLVVSGWAPQAAVLGHRAVGAFLTHCGWNSVLEAVATGVLMLAWPTGADQYVNAALVADELKVAVRVPARSEDLGRVLAESVSGVDRPERERARKLREEALAAVGERGTSAEDLRYFICHLEAIRNGSK